MLRMQYVNSENEVVWIYIFPAVNIPFFLSQKCLFSELDIKQSL